MTQSASAVSVAQQTGPAPPPTKDQKPHGPNVAGIAAGVVVGVIALIAICVGIFLFLRHKRRKEAEDEYKRSTAVNDFMRQKPPQTAQSNMSDSRLDPEAMMARRTSIGSIADNQDYSRRILRVSCTYRLAHKRTVRLTRFYRSPTLTAVASSRTLN